CQAYASPSGAVPVQVPAVAVSSLPASGVPSIVGAAVDAGGAAATGCVGGEATLAEPAAFVAVTSTWTRAPTSSAPSTSGSPVAPATATQETPAALQRRHWYVKASGAVPDQTPVEAVSVLPSSAVPETAGSEVTTGARAGGVAAVTTPV